jgi:hypothetical protein
VSPVTRAAAAVELAWGALHTAGSGGELFVQPGGATDSIATTTPAPGIDLIAAIIVRPAFAMSRRHERLD